MSSQSSLNPNFERRVRESFTYQGLINALNGKITHVSPGELHITAPFDERLTQQDGFLHAGVVATPMDSTSRRDPACGTGCGYATYTLMPADSRVPTVEFKVHFLSPAQGEHFRAEDRVIKSGKTVTVCEGKLFASSDGQETLVTVMQATMICVPAAVGRGVHDRGGMKHLC
jgi:uncharacterized protein (TIGR00369 family)